METINYSEVAHMTTVQEKSNLLQSKSKLFWSKMASTLATEAHKSLRYAATSSAFFFLPLSFSMSSILSFSKTSSSAVTIFCFFARSETYKQITNNYIKKHILINLSTSFILLILRHFTESQIRPTFPHQFVPHSKKISLTSSAHQHTIFFHGPSTSSAISIKCHFNDFYLHDLSQKQRKVLSDDENFVRYRMISAEMSMKNTKYHTSQSLQKIMQAKWTILWHQKHTFRCIWLKSCSCTKSAHFQTITIIWKYTFWIMKVMWKDRCLISMFDSPFKTFQNGNETVSSSVHLLTEWIEHVCSKHLRKVLIWYTASSK